MKHSDFNHLKGWLYLLPAILFLAVFMIYPLIDVFVYSFEEGNKSSETILSKALWNSVLRKSAGRWLWITAR